jgi:hypothetical protein
MKAIVFDTELKYFEDYPVPKPGANEALIKVLMAGIYRTKQYKEAFAKARERGVLKILFDFR